MRPPALDLRVAGCSVSILGTIAGFVPDAARVRAAIAAGATDTVALGVPPEDLAGLEQLARDPSSFKDMHPPDDLTGRRLELLKAFGDIRIPSPDLEAAYAAATEKGAKLAAVDLDDATYADAYTKRVRLRHVVVMNSRRKRFLKRAVPAADAYAFDKAWDEAVNDLAPLRELEALREGHMAGRLRELAASSRRLVAVLPAARFDAVAAALGSGTSGPPGPSAPQD